MTLDDNLRDLCDAELPLKHSALLQLSGLPTEEVISFSSCFTAAPVSRRREVINRLTTVADEDPEVDFIGVLRMCLGDADEVVREAAARGLWECGDRALIRPLIEVVNSDPCPTVRAAAVMSLRQFSMMAQDGKLLSRDAERIRQTLLRVIEEKAEEVDVRRRAIESVAPFQEPEIESIVKEAYYSGDRRLRESGIYAMGLSSDPRWLPLLLQELHDQEPAIRFEAANACSMLADESAVPHLTKLVRDEDAHVQVAAVHALGAIGGQLAKRVLIQCVKSGEQVLQEAAQEALDNIELDDDPLGLRFLS